MDFIARLIDSLPMASWSVAYSGLPAASSPMKKVISGEVSVSAAEICLSRAHSSAALETGISVCWESRDVSSMPESESCSRCSVSPVSSVPRSF